MEIVQAVSDADRLLNNLLNPAFLTHRNTISTNRMKEAIMSHQSGVKDLTSPCALSKSLKKQSRETSRAKSDSKMKWWACFPALVFHLEERMHLQVKDDAECQLNKQRPASFLLGSSHACTDTQSCTPPIWPCLGGCGGRADPTCPPRAGNLCAARPADLHACILNYWESCQSHLTQPKWMCHLTLPSQMP